MSDPFDDRLRSRLERLTAAIPVEPPLVGSRPPRTVQRRSLRAVLAAAAMLVVVSLVGTAAFIALNQPQARLGAFNPGGPLHCSDVDQLPPRDAERWMTARGLESRWQLEGTDGDDHSETAPDRGFIVGAVVLDDRSLLMLVDVTLDQPRSPRPCP